MYIFSNDEETFIHHLDISDLLDESGFGHALFKKAFFEVLCDSFVPDLRVQRPC